jgi:hypothetical protein
LLRILFASALLVTLTAGGACSVEVSDALRDALAQLDGAGADAPGPDAAPDVSVGPGGDAATGSDAAACPTGAACDDGDSCTVGDRCDRGRCRGPLAADCDDGDPCTVDACDPTSGCLHAPRDVPECRPPRPCDAPCDDGNPCTVDACDPLAGACAYAPIPSCRPCDPVGDWRSGCDDDDPETEDGCALDEALGGTVCTHLPLPCGLDPAVCDDDDPCTRDVLGRDCLCTHQPLATPECRG